MQCAPNINAYEKEIFFEITTKVSSIVKNQQKFQQLLTKIVSFENGAKECIV